MTSASLCLGLTKNHLLLVDQEETVTGCTARVLHGTLVEETAYATRIATIDAGDTSFITSAIMTPEMSTTAKVVMATATAVDAMVDVNIKGETQTIAGVVGDKKSLDNLTLGFNEAVTSDLSATASATLTKETKSSLKQAQTTINSTGFQTGANAVADYTGGVVGGQANKIVGSTPTANASILVKDPMVQPNDITRLK